MKILMFRDSLHAEIVTLPNVRLNFNAMHGLGEKKVISANR